MSLCAVFLPSLTPVRSLTVRGMSPSALFIPTRILPNLPGVSSTVEKVRTNHNYEDVRQHRAFGRYQTIEDSFEIRKVYSRAEPLPDRNTKSIGHPQFKSTKSTPPENSLPMISATEVNGAGLLPASWIPNMLSDGCLRTRDHSSLEPCKKEVASPTSIRSVYMEQQGRVK